MSTFAPMPRLVQRSRREEIIEISRQWYADRPLPVKILWEQERKKTAAELLEQIELQRHELIRDNPELAFFERLSIKVIVEETGKYYGATYPQMISAQRTKPLPFFRHVAFYLCRELPCGPFGSAATLPEIGRRVGGRDHTTILHGVRKIQARLDKGNAKLVADLDILRGLIKARVDAATHHAVAAE